MSWLRAISGIFVGFRPGTYRLKPALRLGWARKNQGRLCGEYFLKSWLRCQVERKAISCR